MIETKTIGMLIDELITTNIKCWYAQEDIKNLVEDELVAKAARNAQSLNKRRCELIQAIDKFFGIKFSLTEKTY